MLPKRTSRHPSRRCPSSCRKGWLLDGGCSGSLLVLVILLAAGCRSDGPLPPLPWPAAPSSGAAASTAPNACTTATAPADDPLAAPQALATLHAFAAPLAADDAPLSVATAAGAPADATVAAAERRSGGAAIAQVAGTLQPASADAASADLAWLIANTDPLAADGSGPAATAAPSTLPIAGAGGASSAGASSAGASSAGGGAVELLPPPPLLNEPQSVDPQRGALAEPAAPRPQDWLLELEAVLISTTQSFPAVREAAQLRAEALGESQSALGEFDDKLEVFTINQPLGFYENYRHGISWSRPLENGGVAYSGYRLGRGLFEPWYGERDTDNSGEFRAGFEIPLLQNHAIDPRRTAVRLAALELQKASPQLFQQVLAAQAQAAEAYWQWVAVGQQYAIAEELMRLAEQRVQQIERQIQAGDLPVILGIDNRRLLAQRRSRLIEVRQRRDAAAVKLSLYYRDAAGMPIALSETALPEAFPQPTRRHVDIPSDIAEAMDQRPELAILRITAEQLRSELRLAINQQLPELNFSTEASKDIGPLTSPKGDKRPFVLETGLVGSVPVQRRKALGKARALRARLAQLDARVQLTADQIANEVRQAAIAYQAAEQRLQQAMIGKDLARQTLRAGEIAFSAGDIDILLLNIYEQAYADAGLDVIDAQAAMQIALAQWIAARGELLLD